MLNKIKSLLPIIAFVYWSGPASAAPINTVISFNSSPLGIFETLNVGDFVFRWAGFGDLMEVVDISDGDFSNFALSDSNPDNDQAAQVLMYRIDKLSFTVTQFDIIQSTFNTSSIAQLRSGGLLSLVAYGAQNLYLPASAPGTVTITPSGSTSPPADCCSGIAQLIAFGAQDLYKNTAAFEIAGAPTGTPLSVNNISVTSTIPTPATLAIFGLGLAFLGWSRLKKA